MKTDQSFLCTFCAVLYCVLHATDAAKDVLPSMYLSGSEEPNWISKYKTEKKGVQNQWSSFKDYNSAHRVHSNTLNIIRHEMSNALTNKYLRQRFVKVMPILRDLNQEQWLALSELMSDELTSKPELELKFENVRRMISGDRKLVLSLVDDIANQVRNRLKFGLSNSRRTVQLTPEKVKLEQQSMGVEEQIIVPRTINNGLMQGFNFVLTKIEGHKRNKRSAAKLLHKLIRIPPVNITEGLLLKESAPFDMKLNTSSFAGPYYESEAGSQNIDSNITLTYEQIEDLAFADLNGTEIELNGSDTDDEHLPSPEELVAGPRYRISNKHRINLVKADSKRKRIPIRSHQIPILQRKCERFTASMCIKADDYPMEQIMGSIRRHKNAMSALLAEYHDKAAELEYQEQLEEYQFNNKRREDGNVITPGGMCASIVRYARPQKARSASGEWKYIVNTGRHTQTLRLEKCSTPQESCSYLSHNYRSRCTQVYNYHRLLSWDKTRGLHVDIFKVPSCCSCQVDGYRETFPPLGGSKHKDFKDYTPVPNNNPYATLNDEIDYEDEDVEDGYPFGSGFKKKNFQHSELLLESTNIRTEVNPPRLSPTVGSYLRPPSDSYDSQLASKNVRPTYYTNLKNVFNGRSRKPYKNYIPNESRADLEISGTEQSDKEINAYSINDSSRIHHKRTRLHSGSSNIEKPYQAAPLVPSEPVSSYVPTTELTPHMGINPGTKTSKEVNNGKRINYNYHPIIDFFEDHQKSAKGQLLVRNTGTNSIPISTEIITSRDRRIGYGIGGPENSWHPLVANS